MWFGRSFGVGVKGHVLDRSHIAWNKDRRKSLIPHHVQSQRNPSNKHS